MANLQIDRTRDQINADLALARGAVPETRSINGLPLTADITIDAQGGFSSSYLFCDDVIFGGTTPVWHELERQSDGGAGTSHTVTTGNDTYVEMDRYVTPALSTTILPGGNWNFTLFAKTDVANRLQKIKADVYRVDSAGAIVGVVLGTAETANISNTTTVGLSAYCYIAEKTGWAATDRIGIVVSGKRVSNLGTLTWYHDYASGWASAVSTPLTLLHNQMNGLNDGDYRHLTAAQLTNATSAAAAGTASIRAIGSGATDAMAGNATPTPASHVHGNISNAGLIGTTANLPIKTGTGGVLEAGAFGTGATDFCVGNDARLSDTRTPTDASVTNAKLANMSASTFKMRVTASTGVPEDGTATQARAALDPVPQVVNAQTGTTYTLLMADKGKLVTFSNADAIAVTVETSTATWASGERVDLLNIGAGAVTVTGSGVTVSKAATQTAVLAQGKAATLIFISDSVCWMVGGMGAA
jgi:hypothetical protein